MSNVTNSNTSNSSSSSSSSSSSKENSLYQQASTPRTATSTLPIIDTLLASNKKSSYTNDDHVIILTSSSLTSLNEDCVNEEDSLRTHSLVHYLCFCCRCCNITNTIFWSWLSIFCCCCPLLGGISLYFTYKSNKFKLKQKYELADKYSSYAEKLNIASLIFGVLFYAVMFFMITLVLFMYWRHKYS